MGFLGGLVIGLFIGGLVGVATMCLMFVAGESDKRMGIK